MEEEEKLCNETNQQKFLFLWLCQDLSYLTPTSCLWSCLMCSSLASKPRPFVISKVGVDVEDVI